MSADRQRVSSGSPYETKWGFCRALRVGNQIFVSGTAPIRPDGSVDPDSGAQMRRCLEIALKAIEELGGAAGDVVRSRMFVTEEADTEAIGAAHGQVFGENRPVATMVVTKLLNPAWHVELELEAVIG